MFLRERLLIKMIDEARANLDTCEAQPTSIYSRTSPSREEAVQRAAALVNVLELERADAGSSF
jgi:hypothetical protein